MLKITLVLIHFIKHYFSCYFLWITCVLYIVGCAQWLPANSVELSSGVYKIQVVGNSFATLSDLKKKIDIKANELCNDGYSYISLIELETKTSTAYMKDETYEGNYTVVSRSIACNKNEA